MLFRYYVLIVLVLLVSCRVQDQTGESPYLNNRPPLISKQYLELPLGSIRPEGWLMQQLQLMKSGMTG
jgi:hypothetical protein